jgi:hypothetical protein
MSWALVCSDSHGDARKCKPEIKHTAFVALPGSARSKRLDLVGRSPGNRVFGVTHNIQYPCKDLVGDVDP